MKPNDVRDLIDKYEKLFLKHDDMIRAVKYSQESDTKMTLMIGKKQGTNRQFPLEFNLELGQALYQAKFDELKNELEEMKRRIAKWT
jgi:hypothetical protein